MLDDGITELSDLATFDIGALGFFGSPAGITNRE